MLSELQISPDSLSLLAVEDDLSDFLLAKRQFDKLSPSFTLQHAVRVSDALDRFDASEFSAVICDLNLPDGQGIDVVRFIRNTSASIPIIMLTGNGNEAAAVDAIKAGANEYLVKETNSFAQLPGLVQSLIKAKGIKDTGWRTLAELEQAQLRFLDFAEAASDWLWEKGPDLRFTFVSDSVRQILGVDPSFFVGKTLWQTAGKQLPINWREHERCVNNHETFRDFTYRIETPDGDYRAIRVSGKPIFSNDGEFAGYRGIGTDITERIRTEEALKRAKDAAEKAGKVKSEFLAMMSHELRTPLNAVLGFTEALSNGVPGKVNGKQAEYLNYVTRAGQQLLDLVNDILDFSKIQSGTYQLQLEPVNLADAIGDIMDLYATSAEERNITLDLEALDPELTIHANPRAVRQVLTNVFSNSIKFTGEGGNITLRAETGPDTVAVLVEDTGIGIESRNLKSVFDPFFQSGSEMAKEYPGAGLGLAIVNGLMETMGGTLAIDSEVGKGTTVTVVFSRREKA